MAANKILQNILSEQNLDKQRQELKNRNLNMEILTFLHEFIQTLLIALKLIFLRLITSKIIIVDLTIFLMIFIYVYFLMYPLDFETQK